MQHRDKVILQKVYSELGMGLELLGNTSLEDFLNMEDVYNTVYNDFPKLQRQIELIIENI